MKISCGTDIIEVDRVRTSIENVGEKFLKKVFTDNEIRYCESKKTQKSAAKNISPPVFLENCGNASNKRRNSKAKRKN